MGVGEIKARMLKEFNILEKEAQSILDKAVEGGEISLEMPADDWFNDRFLPNAVMIDEKDYAHMCVDALKIVSKTAPTDFGGSRQRDLGQLWADMTRGYLGEIAFVKFLDKNLNIKAKLDHEIGDLEKFLPMDIHEVKGPNDSDFRKPGLTIGIKTIKWNGIWFDIPGDQFNHSEIHVLVKVGTGRDHLIAFFKSISVFKDKILKEGLKVNAISQAEADDMYAKLPSFQPIAAYVCGFALKSKAYGSLPYGGIKKTKNFTINSWNGPIESGDLEKIKQLQGLQADAKIKFLNIGDFAHDKGFLFNTGNLLWRSQDWQIALQNL
jgi:hypothetical protein